MSYYVIIARYETPLIYMMRSLPTPGDSAPTMGPLRTIGWVTLA